MSRYLRCPDCKSTTWVPGFMSEDPTNKIYCNRCNVSRMYMFWIDLTDQMWVKEERESHGQADVR